MSFESSREIALDSKENRAVVTAWLRMELDVEITSVIEDHVWVGLSPNMRKHWVETISKVNPNDFRRRFRLRAPV